jgi:hypothetical protein
MESGSAHATECPPEGPVRNLEQRFCSGYSEIRVKFVDFKNDRHDIYYDGVDMGFLEAILTPILRPFFFERKLLRRTDAFY